MRSTEAVINVACIRRNVEKIKRLAGSAETAVMVKADGYGHGLVQAAHAAVEGGADALGVAMAEEAIALRNAGIEGRVISVGAILDVEEAEAASRYEIEQTVFRPDTVRLLAAAAEKAGKPIKVHIKIETGMHRLGVSPDKLDELLEAVADTRRYVEVAGVFTHFAESDSADKSYTYEQNRIFSECADKVKAKYPSAKRHASCSGAILSCEDLRYDMVRAGIVAYGYYPSDELARVIEPEQAFTLHTSVTNLHTIHAGETVSYGRTFKAHRDTLVATIPIGYGDGYRRSLSNTGFVLIGGRRAPVIGRVCMDQTMVDVTDCGGVAVGSEVVLIGNQGGEAIWADELAQWCGTISYEIMLGITQRVRRKYIDI